MISARLRNHAWRGLFLIFPGTSPDTMSQVHFTSAEVNGFPSCHFTPERKAKVNEVPSSLHVQPVASSGRIVSMVFCGTC